MPDNDKQVQDFSHSGLGIGGLANHSEPVTVPTIAQMKRLEKIENEMQVCRRCSDRDLIDVAMFTTGGGDVCDDCF